jgi:hypothetical protein
MTNGRIEQALIIYQDGLKISSKANIKDDYKEIKEILS